MLYPIELWVQPFIYRHSVPAPTARRDNLILKLDTAWIKRRQSMPDIARLWQKTQFSNSIRYTPSGTYFARLRVNGKLIRKALKTDVLSAAKLRQSGFEKVERQGAESRTNVSRGKLTFGEALEIYRQRINGAVTLKQRSKDHSAERIAALRNSWPDLEKTDIRKVTKADCMNCGASFGHGASPTACNITQSRAS